MVLFNGCELRVFLAGKVRVIEWKHADFLKKMFEVYVPKILWMSGVHYIFYLFIKVFKCFIFSELKTETPRYGQINSIWNVN